MGLKQFKMKEGKTYANIDIGLLTPIFRFSIVIILINWIFQGLLYADRTEKIFKIVLDFGVTIILFLILWHPNIVVRSLISFFISHTLSWAFNGQLFALAKNFDIVNTEPCQIIEYANKIKIRASKESSINCVLIYGSLVRDEIKSTSDLDMRIIRRPGFINGIRACSFGLMERFRALINRFPLDMYVIDGVGHLHKMRSDETPEILYDPNNIMSI